MKREDEAVKYLAEGLGAALENLVRKKKAWLKESDKNPSEIILHSVAIFGAKAIAFAKTREKDYPAIDIFIGTLLDAVQHFEGEEGEG